LKVRERDGAFADTRGARSPDSESEQGAALCKRRLISSVVENRRTLAKKIPDVERLFELAVYDDFKVAERCEAPARWPPNLYRELFSRHSSSASRSIKAA